MYLFTSVGILRAMPYEEGSYSDPEIFVVIEGGRPLSGAFDARGNIYFCDVILVCSLLSLSPKGVL